MSGYDAIKPVFGGGGGGISNVVEDTTPQLGGNLDGQTYDITTTGDITGTSLVMEGATRTFTIDEAGGFQNLWGTGTVSIYCGTNHGLRLGESVTEYCYIQQKVFQPYNTAQAWKLGNTSTQWAELHVVDILASGKFGCNGSTPATQSASVSAGAGTDATIIDSIATCLRDHGFMA